jgi:hypothetical protein
MSVDITVVEGAWWKDENIRSFQPTFWLSSAVELCLQLVKATVLAESSLHFQLFTRLPPLLWCLQTWVMLVCLLCNIFLSFYLSRISFYINIFFRFVFFHIFIIIFILYQYKKKTWKGKMIKNMLKWRKESDTYLTHVCRHRWSRQLWKFIYFHRDLSA